LGSARSTFINASRICAARSGSAKPAAPQKYSVVTADHSRVGALQIPSARRSAHGRHVVRRDETIPPPITKGPSHRPTPFVAHAFWQTPGNRPGDLSSCIYHVEVERSDACTVCDRNGCGHIFSRFQLP